MEMPGCRRRSSDGGRTASKAINGAPGKRRRKSLRKLQNTSFAEIEQLVEREEHSGRVDGRQTGLVDLGNVQSGQTNPVLEAGLPEEAVAFLDGCRREVDAKTPDVGIQSAEHAQECPIAASQIEHALVAVGNDDVVHHGKEQQIL